MPLLLYDSVYREAARSDDPIRSRLLRRAYVRGSETEKKERGAPDGRTYGKFRSWTSLSAEVAGLSSDETESSARGKKPCQSDNFLCPVM